jgi:putative spermidine/putrescine transport system permease protein
MTLAAITGVRPAGALRALRHEGALALPLALYSAFFFMVPLLLLVAISLFVNDDLEAMGLDQYRKFFGDAFNWGVLAATLALGLKTVALTLVIGYPVALVFVQAGPRAQKLLLLLIILPLLTSVVVRTFAWVVILGKEGLVNGALIELGLAAAPIRLLHTELGLIIALSQIEMPLMLLPLISVMSRIDPNLLDASAALGAGRWRTLYRVILPLSVPGLAAGCLLVFASAVTAFISQSVIGGGQLIYLPTFIWQQSMVLVNWPFSATLAVVLLVSVMLVIATIGLVQRQSRGQIYG